MRLTPADVHNVAFKKPSIGKRGYDEDEVDAFLDLVEAEFARLIEENNDLSERVSALESSEGTSRVADGEAAPVSTEQAHTQAARLLALAQETADKLTSEAREAAAADRSSAKEESDKVRAEAQAESERLLAEAKNQSEAMVGDATSHAEAAERDSRTKAEALDKEAKDKYESVMGSLTSDRSSLERKIDDLRAYEREYRGRLREWISEQLTRLDENGSREQSNAKASAGAPAAAE